MGRRTQCEGGGLLTALFLFCLLGEPAFAQNGLAFVNQGVKGAGRGGASTALADDSLSVARNPALLSRLSGTRVDGTLVFNGERARRRNRNENVLDEHYGVWPLPILGFSTNLSPEQDGLDPRDFEEPLRGPSLGFGLFQPIQGVVAPTATFALDLTETLSFGISVSMLASRLSVDTYGESKGGGGRSPISDFRPAGKVFQHYQPDGTPVTPPQPFDPGTGQQLTWAEVFDVGLSAVPSGGGSGAPADPRTKPSIEFELSDVFGVGIAAQLGFLWTPRDDLSVGLSVRTPGIIFEPKGKGVIDLTQAIDALENNSQIGLLISALADTTLPDRASRGLKGDYDVTLDDVVIPASISVGVAWWPLPSWVLTLDVRWIGWSASLDEIKIKGTGGTNRDLNAITGGPGLEYVLRLDWKDQLVVAVGTTFAVNDWLLLRAGYNHGDNPVAPTTVFANSAVIEDHLSVGVGVRFGGWDFDLAYVYGLPKQVELDGAAFRVELHQLFLGVGYGF